MNNNQQKTIELLLKVIGLALGGFILFHAFRFVFETVMFLIKG